MAGIYDDAPNRRMAYDEDGTVAVISQVSGAGAASEISGANKIVMNSESEGTFQIAGFTNIHRYVTLVFPELRDLDGIFWAYSGSFSPTDVDSSADTTNGIGGTWPNQIPNLANYTTVGTNFRDQISGLSAVAHKAIRVLTQFGSNSNNNIMKCYHVYGTIGAGETPDRILFLDTENSDAVFTRPLDFGEVPRGQTTTRTFKIKNNSSSKTINTINVTATDLYLNAGDWYEFGDDGISWDTTFAVGNMSNGAEQLLYLKQVIPGGETLGVQTARIKVSHASVS